MEFIVQVGDGQMHPAIQRIGRGETVAALATHIDDAELTAESSSGAWRRLFQHLLIATAKTDLPQQRNVWPLLRRDRACG